MILLDTNVLSELMKPAPEAHVVTWMDALPTADLFINAVTRAEIELGIALLPAGRRRDAIHGAAHRMFALFDRRCLPFDDGASIHYGRVVAHRTRIGRPITVEDAQIASIALAYGLDLATRNTKDYAEIPGLTVINPWAP